MRISLDQDEIFEALTTFLHNKMKLDANASFEISMTAGRSPKGYTADVEISYEKSEMTSRCVARNDDTEQQAPSETTDVEAPAAAGTASAVDLFDN